MFSDFYANAPSCTPTRAGFITGRYQQRLGLEAPMAGPATAGDRGVPATGRTLPRLLKNNGYATALVGKWHLGYPAAYQPNARGFDWFYGCLQGSRSYHPYAHPTPLRVLQENGVPTPESGYVTDRLGDAACRFIAEHRAEPFFLCVSFTAPHGPLEPRKAADERLAHIGQGRRHDYAGLVVALDDNVGKILAALSAAGLEDDTLVVFTNDNGGQTQTAAHNAPLRGSKGDLYEGGVRVPLAMRWPGRIAPGSVVDDPVIALDLLPTCVSLAGGMPADDWELDGVDLFPRLTGERDALPERTLFWRRHGEPGPIAMRAGRWKVVHNRQKDGARPELYDLHADVGEERDLAGEQADVLASLLAELAAWERELAPPRWSMNAVPQ
jgi:arylsulfatase A-like enzyme